MTTSTIRFASNIKYPRNIFTYTSTAAIIATVFPLCYIKLIRSFKLMFNSMVHLRSTSHKLDYRIDPSLGFFPTLIDSRNQRKLEISHDPRHATGRRIRNGLAPTHPVHAFILDCVMQGDPHAALRETLLTLILINYSPTMQLRYTISLSLSLSPRGRS